jgi:hypothetical protein
MLFGYTDDTVIFQYKAANPLSLNKKQIPESPVV